MLRNSMITFAVLLIAIQCVPFIGVRTKYNPEEKLYAQIQFRVKLTQETDLIIIQEYLQKWIDICNNTLTIEEKINNVVGQDPYEHAITFGEILAVRVRNITSNLKTLLGKLKTNQVDASNMEYEYETIKEEIKHFFEEAGDKLDLEKIAEESISYNKAQQELKYALDESNTIFPSVYNAIGSFFRRGMMVHPSNLENGDVVRLQTSDITKLITMKDQVKDLKAFEQLNLDEFSNSLSYTLAANRNTLRTVAQKSTEMAIRHADNLEKFLNFIVKVNDEENEMWDLFDEVDEIRSQEGLQMTEKHELM